MRIRPLGVSFVVLPVVGLALGFWLVINGLTSPPVLSWWAVGGLVAAVFVAELLPVPISYRGRARDQLTFSNAFLIPLLIVAPLGIAVLARSLPMVFDDLSDRKSAAKVVANLAQVGLCLAAFRWAFVLVSGDAYFEPAPFTPGDVPALAAAVAAYFVVEHLYFSLVGSLLSGASVMNLMRNDLGSAVVTQFIDLALAPLALVAAAFSPAMPLLLLLPMLAVRKSTQLSSAREEEALRDPLTGLPNRSFLAIHLEEAVEDRKQLGVLMIDLDHFREINNILGHRIGDELVSDVSRRLSGVLRSGDFVARIGGDEFAVVASLDGPDFAAEAEQLADRLILGLLEPFQLGKVRIDVQASIGIALAPEHGRSVELIMSRADNALYVAKETRGCWAMYDGGQEVRAPEHLSLLGQLRDGIDRGELELHYQPKISVSSGEVTGAEALVRWRHPEKGLLAPIHFIPLAENTGLIRALTSVVLDQALAQARRWIDAGAPLEMAVNLSARHVGDHDLPQEIADALAKHGVPASLLTLEVTESSLMRDPDRARAVLADLRALGVHISVDDFGTGYSSLSHLRQLEIDEIKIDRSFIRHLATSEHDEVIVRSTIELGHNLGLRVVAEGVEDLAVWERLAELGCDQAQGYWMSRPLPEGEIDIWLAGRSAKVTVNRV